MKIKNVELKVENLSYLHCSSINESEVKFKNLQGPLEIEELEQSTIELGSMSRLGGAKIGRVRDSTIIVKKPRFLDKILFDLEDSISNLTMVIKDEEAVRKFISEHRHAFDTGRIKIASE